MNDADTIDALANLVDACREMSGAHGILRGRYELPSDEPLYAKGLRHGFANAARMIEDELAAAGGLVDALRGPTS